MRKIPTSLIMFVAVALVVLLSGVFTAPKAESAPQGRVLIVGDSMSSWYTDENTVSRGWWSIVADRYGMDPILSAEAGSGMWARGNKCQGTKFGDRLNSVSEYRPQAIIVAGGFNDQYGCTSSNRKVPITKASTIKAFRAYYTNLAQAADSIGLSRSKVYVFTPWGSSYRSAHYWIWRAQQAEAEKLGLTYRVVRFNDAGDTLDGIHPNTSGNQKIAARFIAAGGLE